MLRENKELEQNEIVVTEAMIEAGIKYLSKWRVEEVYDDVKLFVSEIFEEMRNADSHSGLDSANLK